MKIVSDATKYQLKAIPIVVPTADRIRKKKMGLKSSITYLFVIVVLVLVLRVGWYYLEHNPALQASLGLVILSSPSATSATSSISSTASPPSTSNNGISSGNAVNPLSPTQTASGMGVHFKASKDVVAAATASVSGTTSTSATGMLHGNPGATMSVPATTVVTAYSQLSNPPPPPPQFPITPPKVEEKPIPCVGNTEWCNIPMPTKSLFRFPNPPNDPVRWSKAQQAAIAEEPLLLRRVVPHFPNPFDYLDGDIWFRKYHAISDAYIDHNVELRMLTPEGKADKDGNVPTFPIKEKYKFHDHRQGKQVIPDMKDIHHIHRAPIVQLGYHAFGRGDPGDRPLQLFNGPVIGEAIIDRPTFLRMFEKYQREIVLPWIGFHSANENWGILSTYFPNRTTNWGSLDEREHKMLMNYLNHNKTVMFLVNQHHNITHPKLITFPRGIPLHMEDGHRTMFNAQRALSVHDKKKSDFVFTASSNWGPRPRISECVGKKFQAEKNVKFAQYGDNRAGRYTVEQYYDKLGTAKFSIALPGLGYDTHR